MMRSISSLTHIVNLRSVVISLLAVLATWLCLRLDIKADFPLTLIATAIVFPIVFRSAQPTTDAKERLRNMAR